MTIQLHYNNWLIGGDGNVANECCCGTETGTSPCSGNCDGTNCPGSDPSVRLCVFDADYAGGDINWCGETWTQVEVQSGTSKCICPDFYTNFDAGSNGYNTWYKGGDNLRIGHQVISTGSIGILFVHMQSDAMGTYRSSRKTHYIPTTSSTSGTNFGGFPSAMPAPIVSLSAAQTTDDFQIRDGQFISFISSGIQYSWAKGDNWP